MTFESDVAVAREAVTRAQVDACTLQMVAELWRRTATALAVGEAVGKALDEYYDPKKNDPLMWPHDPSEVGSSVVSVGSLLVAQQLP